MTAWCSAHSLYCPHPDCCFSVKYSCQDIHGILEQPAKARGAKNVGESPSSSFFLTPPGICVRINASKQLSAVSSFCGSVQLTVSQGNSSCSGPQQLLSQALIPAVHPVSYFVALSSCSTPLALRAVKFRVEYPNGCRCWRRSALG